MRKIYFDTNQLYYIRRIADEAEGWDYGNYGWAIRMFPNDTYLVQDIRALCYIIALQFEWELEFFPSNASYTEVSRSYSQRAQDTRDAWVVFTQGLLEDQQLRLIPPMPETLFRGGLSLEFIDDIDDRAIIRDFANSGAEVLLTSDDHILSQRERLADLELIVMRPSEWINRFLSGGRGSEDAVDWIERILFGIGDK